MPSMRGMFTSVITRSTGFSRAYSSASCPSEASTTSYPADSSVAFTICRIEVESSTVIIILAISFSLSTSRRVRRRPYCLSQSHDVFRHPAEWQDFLRGTHLDRGAGHAPHHARSFILRHGACTGVQHFLEAARAVVTHAGEDRADRVRTHVLRHGAEQHVHARTVTIDGRAVVETAAITRAVALDQQVLAARRDVDVAGHDVLAVGRLDDGHRGERIHALRERQAEGLGNVLCDHDRRAVVRETHEDF